MINLLELRDVRKYFRVKGRFPGVAGKTVKAVDGVSLLVRPGEHLGVVGESGSGKSTLARCIMKLTPVDEGWLVMENEEYSGYSRRKMRPLYKKIQMVFQDPYSSLDPRCTVRDILQEAVGLVKDSCRTRESQLGLMTAMLKDVQLPGRVLERYPHEFSGGERQRIAIARALIVRPRLLILDEAVSSLDVITQGQIIELLRELERQYQLTYLFISHNLRVVKKISRRVAVMYQGKIVEIADLSGIFQEARHPYTRQLLRAALDYQPEDLNFRLDPGQKLELVDPARRHFVMV
jgi:ABC-type oligopeptide transport system ATPase subunit